MAQILADQPQGKSEFRYSEWGPLEELTSGVYELLQVLINVQVASNNGKPVPVVRAPRPTGALHRVRQRRRIETHHNTLRKLLPSKYGDGDK